MGTLDVADFLVSINLLVIFWESIIKSNSENIKKIISWQAFQLTTRGFFYSVRLTHFGNILKFKSKCSGSSIFIELNALSKILKANSGNIKKIIFWWVLKLATRGFFYSICLALIYIILKFHMKSTGGSKFIEYDAISKIPNLYDAISKKFELASMKM